MRFSTLYLIPLFLFCVGMSYGQNYAVQSTVQLLQPYSVYLSDYATDGNQKLRVILRQGDLSRPVYQLRLVMSVELNGRVIMRTSRFFNPAPITLDPGVPTVIAGAELAPYVDSRNIDFIGYSKEQYEKTKALPEGSYQITFTAYDYRRQDQQVSNAGSAFYYLAKNEPPLINYPACGSKLPIKTPQQIIFSWMPRNTSSPTSAQDTEYEFTLYETRPEGRNPNDVVLSSQPVFRLRTDYTQIIYGPAEPMLLDNMVYVWRVQAIDRSGKDAFRNNGYSEVCTFKYGGTDPNFDIGVVKGLNAIGETDQRAKVWWEPGDFDAYRVYYKKPGDQWQWFFNEVTQTEFKIFDLEPDNEYEVRVQGKKDGYYSPFTEIIKFRTREKIVAQCGDPSVTPEVIGPLQQAYIGMTINMSGSKVTLTQIENLGGGWFKGYGKAVLRYLGATYDVKFDRLYIDENLEAGDGDVDVITRGMAAMATEQLTAQKEKQQEENRQEWAGTDFYEKIVSFDYAIDNITVDASGNLLIDKKKGPDVVNTEVPAILAKNPDKAIIAQDANGDQFVIQRKDGQTKVTKVDGGGLSPGGTDVKLTEMIIVSLKKYQKAIDDYQASNKAVQPGKGGGPSLFAWELDMLLAELPECLAGNKERLTDIKTKIMALLEPQATIFEPFAKTIEGKISENPSQDQVDKIVCEALLENFFSKEQSVLLLSQIHDSNSKQEKQLDIVAYSGGKGTWQNYSLGDQTFQFLSIKIYSLPVTSTIRTMLISPPEIYKDNIKAWENTNGDFVKFTFHEGGISDRSGPFNQPGKILLEVVVNKNEEIKLENYLFNSNVRVQIYDGDKPITKGTITYISNEPRMPAIKAKSLLEKGNSEMKLVIVDSLRRRYNGVNSLVRADVSYYPGEDTWQTVKPGETWTVDFGNDFRGGKVYLIQRANKVTDTTTFYIRGRNPTQAQVQAFLASTPGGNAWYFVKLIRHESSTLNRGDDFRHFNPGDAGASNSSSGGRPSWGPPYGWGLMQLDNLGTTLGTFTAFNSRYGPSADELWSWQANIRKGIQFFNDFKLAEANTQWNRALRRIDDWNFLHPNYVQEAYPMLIIESLLASEINTRVTSITAGDEDNSEIIVSSRQPNVRTHRILRDAFALKYYNGGANYFSLVIPDNDAVQNIEVPYWKIDKTQFNGTEQHDYVNILCGRPAW